MVDPVSTTPRHIKFAQGCAYTFNLPKGKTCGDCVSQARCLYLGLTKLENTDCDFWPIRFHELGI